MIGLRFSVFIFLSVLCLSGTGVFASARAEEPSARPEIEVNTTVLDELEGYTPPPMFGTPGRPTLSRPIERLALPARKSSPDSLKSRAERDGLRLARPIIEEPRPTPAKSNSVKSSPANMRLATSENTPEPTTAPVPPSKPHLKTDMADPNPAKLAKAPAPPPAPPARTMDIKTPPIVPPAKNLEVVAAKPIPAPHPAATRDAPPMPAMPTQIVSQETLKTPPAAPKIEHNKTLPQAQQPPASAPPVSGEALLAAPETALPSPAQALATLEPAAGPAAEIAVNDIDITAYEAPERPLVPVSADISAGPALKRPPVSKSPATSHETRRPDLLEEASLTFRKGQSDLDSAQTTPLKTKISTALIKNSRARIQILSYASPADDGQSSARRVSLLRALSVRSWLVSRGISPARIDVRALGEASAGTGDSDRIDLVVYDPVRKS